MDKPEANLILCSVERSPSSWNVSTTAKDLRNLPCLPARPPVSEEEVTENPWQRQGENTLPDHLWLPAPALEVAAQSHCRQLPAPQGKRESMRWGNGFTFGFINTPEAFNKNTLEC